MAGKTHIIVGDGITALAFLQGRSFQGYDTLVLVGKVASRFGRGIAYEKGEPGTPWRYAYLLNSPADDIDPEFAVWVSENWAEIRSKMEGRKPDWLAAAKSLVEAGDVKGLNAPREFYGDYMEIAAGNLLAEFETKGIEIERIEERAVSLVEDAGKIGIRTEGGQEIVADSVDIAPGGPETMRFEGDDGPFSVPSVFGYEHRIAEHIKAGAEIFCIGGNAAMLDVLRLCQSLIPNDALKFVFCAPEGEVPPPLVPRMPRILTTPTLTTGHLSADSFLSEIRREIEAAQARGEEMREIRAGFRVYFLANPLRLFVADLDEAAKVSKQLRFWLRGGTRDTIFDMRQLVESGHVRILKGFARSITHRARGPSVEIESSDGEVKRVETGFVVNCAGAGPQSAFDPLTQDLLNKGLIERASGGGLKVHEGCRTIIPSARYLSPAVTQIGADVVAMPLYDAHMLRTYAWRANKELCADRLLEETAD